MKNNKGSFVVVSDFHSMEYPLNKVKNYYINEYEYVYILGDATDRGERMDGSRGVEILIEIMKLEKETGKVHYVPGNHDQFLYDYAMYNDYNAMRNLEYNYGDETINTIDRMKRENPKQLRELLTWLGSKPIQVVHEYNNQKFALAHAFFDMELYLYNPDLALKDFKDQRRTIKEDMDNIIWFRKSRDEYDKNKVPGADYTIVIGHTPSSIKDHGKYNLENKDGKMITVHCVDGGVTFGNDMLKYDGKKHVLSTMTMSHKNTSNKPTKTYASVKYDSTKVEEMQKYLTDYIENNGECFNFEKCFKYCIKEYNLDTEETKKIIMDVTIRYVVKKMLDVFSFDICRVFNNMYGWLIEEDKTYITSFGNARAIADNINVNRVKKYIGKSSVLADLVKTVYIDYKASPNYRDEQIESLTNFIVRDSKKLRMSGMSRLADTLYTIDGKVDGTYDYFRKHGFVGIDCNYLSTIAKEYLKENFPNYEFNEEGKLEEQDFELFVMILATDYLVERTMEKCNNDSKLLKIATDAWLTLNFKIATTEEDEEFFRKLRDYMKEKIIFSAQRELIDTCIKRHKNKSKILK